MTYKNSKTKNTPRNNHLICTAKPKSFAIVSCNEKDDNQRCSKFNQWI